MDCASSEEYSDDYQTDYEEEDAAGSAPSDYELSYLASELTEGEETADTAETVCQHNLDPLDTSWRAE